jgi:predicted PurR-regulated permease PerM
VATPSLAAAQTSLQAVFSTAWLLILALFWSYGGPSFEARCLALLPPSHRARIAATWHTTVEVTGRAIASLITSLTTSFISLFLVFHLINMPYGGVIAALVAVVRLLPFAGVPTAIAIAFACGALAGPWLALLAGCVTCALLFASRHLLGRVDASPTPPFLLALCTFALVQLSGFAAALLGPVLGAALAALLATRLPSARTSQA